MAIAMVKVTFTLDEATVDRLNRVAARKAIPKSQAVREAIEDYHAKADKLSVAESQRLVKILAEYMAMPPTRSQAEVDREIAEIRAVRRLGGRLHPTE
ncbi:MAG: ribbon-helix-helix protein, CopG family [Acidobacteriota bacterium]